MKINEIAGSKVIEIPLEIKDTKSIVNTVETCISLLTYNKPKPRTIIVPGNIEDLPDEIPGGLFKTAVTPEGVVYTTNNSAPGIQIESNIFYDEPTLELFKVIYNKIVDLHIEITGEKYLPKYQHSWFFINPPNNDQASYHAHTLFNTTFPYDTSTYTWTYYLQLPDNCKGAEGKLGFKQSENSVEELLDVKLNTLYIFPASLLHQPNLSPYSSLNRITAAGNILIPASTKSILD
jgi:hypothetical protein